MSDEALRMSTAATVAKWSQPPPETIAILPKPTRRDNKKGQCNECNGYHGLPAVHLDYMGHADVTLALLEIDPAWCLEPVTDATGIPIVQNQSGRLVLWAHLTINGVTRLCVGTCGDNKGDPEKELIGDAIRNGAMRFGVGTRLWSKSDSADPAGSGRSGGYSVTPTAHPNAGRIAALKHDWEKLDDNQKTAGHKFASDQGFTMTPKALETETHLEQMESWVDEQLHGTPTTEEGE